MPLQADLLAWFDQSRRDLPWRRSRDPYAIWVSEVMLQQTQVATVVPYFERFLARFPDVRALAAAPVTDVLAGWSGLGYYSRARNLHAAARVVAAAGGLLPSTAGGLRALPGFGRYTSAAVASIAFGEQVALVDGNVDRVLARLFAVPGRTGERERDRHLWSLAESLVPADRPGDWNQALMELGATVCRPRDPLCLLCPVRCACQALAQGLVASLPAPRVRPPRRPLTLAAAVVTRRGRVLLGRRREKGLFGGLWELPCTELVGAPKGSLRAMGFTPGRREPRQLGTIRRTLTHRDLEIRLFEVPPPKAGAPQGYDELRWVDADGTKSLGVSTAMRRALALVFL